jgi:hypothetical protein
MALFRPSYLIRLTRTVSDSSSTLSRHPPNEPDVNGALTKFRFDEVGPHQTLIKKKN